MHNFPQRRGRRTNCTAAVRSVHLNIQSVVATGGVYKGQGRNQRELMTRAYWEFLVHGEKLQAPIPSTKEVQRVTRSFRTRSRHDDSFSVARVRPRTSKGITDLLLLNLAWLNATCPSKKLAPTKSIGELVNRLESRSLSELTRQIAPPTKNGHAPPPTESRKSYQSVNPYGVWAG